MADFEDEEEEGQYKESDVEDEIDTKLEED